MRTQQRNKRTIYLCKRQVVGNIIKYQKPIEIKENCRTVTSDAELLTMGMEYPTRMRIKTDLRVRIDGEWVNRTDLYHVGDRVYVFAKPPEEHDSLCKNADYEVEIEPIIGTTPNQLDIVLVRLSGSNRRKTQ